MLPQPPTQTSPAFAARLFVLVCVCLAFQVLIFRFAQLVVMTCLRATMASTPNATLNLATDLLAQKETTTCLRDACCFSQSFVNLATSNGASAGRCLNDIKAVQYFCANKTDDCSLSQEQLEIKRVAAACEPNNNGERPFPVPAVNTSCWVAQEHFCGCGRDERNTRCMCGYDASRGNETIAYWAKLPDDRVFDNFDADIRENDVCVLGHEDIQPMCRCSCSDRDQLTFWNYQAVGFTDDRKDRPCTLDFAELIGNSVDSEIFMADIVQHGCQILQQIFESMLILSRIRTPTCQAYYGVNESIPLTEQLGELMQRWFPSTVEVESDAFKKLECSSEEVGIGAVKELFLRKRSLAMAGAVIVPVVFNLAVVVLAVMAVAKENHYTLSGYVVMNIITVFVYGGYVGTSVSLREAAYLSLNTSNSEVTKPAFNQLPIQYVQWDLFHSLFIAELVLSIVFAIAGLFLTVLNVRAMAKNSMKAFLIVGGSSALRKAYGRVLLLQTALFLEFVTFSMTVLQTLVGELFHFSSNTPLYITSIILVCGLPPLQRFISVCSRKERKVPYVLGLLTLQAVPSVIVFSIVETPYEACSVCPQQWPVVVFTQFLVSAVLVLLSHIVTTTLGVVCFRQFGEGLKDRFSADHARRHKVVNESSEMMGTGSRASV